MAAGEVDTVRMDLRQRFYWLGAAAGAALTLVLLDTQVLAKDIGWRVAFGLGAVLGLVILRSGATCRRARAG